MDYYILDGDKPVKVGLRQWAKWFESADFRRIVKQTSCVVPGEDEAFVSTVFLGIDHNFFGDGPPLVFETMVFGGKHDQAQERYSTWNEAEAGHWRWVSAVGLTLERTENDQG